MKGRRHRILAGITLICLTLPLVGPVWAQQAQPGFAGPAFQRVWERIDRPVAAGEVKRSWYWGPAPISAATNEPNKESPGGNRIVQYFDKSRMEINNPDASPNDPFYVTNGLLTVELISGRVQAGASTYTERYPACINVTGDAGDATAPTYAALGRVSNTTLGDHPATSNTGVVTATLSRTGDVGNDPSKANIAEARNAFFDDVTKHNIPDAFWKFLNATGPVYQDGRTANAQLNNPWFYASGRPISEAYWTKATIAGKAADVLVQMYERRALTFVPANPEGFKVEMGNIGQHYYDWRYKDAGRCGPAASGEVSFQTFGDPAELAVFQAVVESYKSANPNVKVNMNHIPEQGDHISRLTTSFAAGTPPDVFLINYRRYGQFAARGVLEPLGNYLAESVTLKASDYYTQSLTAFTFDGTLQCIPQNISSLSVYYNKDLFQQYNVPLPKADWTWQDFLNTAKALTRDTNGDGKTDVYGLATDPQLIRVAPFIWQNNGEVVDNYDKPTKMLIDSPAAREALQFFVDLSLVHKVVPTQAEAQAESLTTRFLNGKLGMWLASRADTPTFRTIKTFTWDVNPLPGNKSRATILHSDAYCMASASKNKTAAWDFIQHALGPRGQTVASELGRIVPSLKSVANSPAFLDPSKPPANSKMYLDVIPTI
ncbi:MAG TPA: sugar ABC transporter substrate-binding protein, partial [Chloroflexia bacterium]|nr:sugar ABC transporter substrate-binding protein [Chloroflexia bacterium]